MTLDGEEANVGVVGRLDFFICVLGEPKRQAHVRLATAEPDIADEDVVQFNRLMTADGYGIRAASRRRLNSDDPAAICAGSAGCCVRADLHADIVSRIRPAPDGIGLAALKHHVVAEDGADERKRLNGRGLCGLAGCRLRKCSNGSRRNKRSCGKRCALNVSETHNSKPLTISVRGLGIGSCGRPGCRRFRCTARVLDKRTAVGCDRGMPDRWRSRNRAQCLSRPS